jgi:hypothetical protein
MAGEGSIQPKRGEATTKPDLMASPFAGTQSTGKKSVYEKIAEILGVSEQDIIDLFPQGAKVDRETFNKFFSKYARLKDIKISKEAWDAYFGDQDKVYDKDKDSVASPEKFLQDLKDMQEIAEITNDTIGRMLVSTDVRLVDKEQITKMVKEMRGKSGYELKLSGRISAIRDKLTAMGDDSAEIDGKIDYLLGIKLIYGREDGVFALLTDKAKDYFNGVNLLNARVMKEFCDNILDSFIEERYKGKDGKSLEKAIKELKDLSGEIEATEKWLKKMEPGVEGYLHSNGTLKNGERISLKLTREDYGNDEIWGSYISQIMKRDLGPKKLWDDVWSKIQVIRNNWPKPTDLVASPAPTTPPETLPKK